LVTRKCGWPHFCKCCAKLLSLKCSEGDISIVREPAEQQFLLATLPPSRGQIRLALGISVALLVAFGVTAPFARTPLLRLDGFVPAHQGIYAVNDLITSALLFAQFSIVRRWALLALAIGFLYTALIAISHALAFPGAFSPTGLLGAKLQTTAWLYNFWKVGLPLAVIVYALLKDADGWTSISERSPRVVIRRTCCRDGVRADLDLDRRGRASANNTKF
jgi:hypothetical protein